MVEHFAIVVTTALILTNLYLYTCQVLDLFVMVKDIY